MYWGRKQNVAPEMVSPYDWPVWPVIQYQVHILITDPALQDWPPVRQMRRKKCRSPHSLRPLFGAVFKAEKRICAFRSREPFNQRWLSAWQRRRRQERGGKNKERERERGLFPPRNKIRKSGSHDFCQKRIIAGNVCPVPSIHPSCSYLWRKSLL